MGRRPARDANRASAGNGTVDVAAAADRWEVDAYLRDDGRSGASARDSPGSAVHVAGELQPFEAHAIDARASRGQRRRTARVRNCRVKPRSWVPAGPHGDGPASTDRPRA